MKQFFKFLFASMFGFILGSIILFFIFIAIITAAVSSMGSEEVSITDQSILQISFNQEIKERSSNNPFESLDLNNFTAKQQPGLNGILKDIEKAAKDPKIKGIFLDVPNIQGGMATVEEIRNELLKFKKSGKFIYAYADAYSQGAYYLVSVSDKIYLNPQGLITLNGLATELMFFKGTLEKLEVEPQVIRHGKYKSAIEPFILDKMSDENRAQIAGFVNPIWFHMTDGIAAGRKLEASEVLRIADSLYARNADDALRLKLVDKLGYYDEFMAELNIKSGKGKNEKMNFVTLAKYDKVPEPVSDQPFSKDRIAVIYAVGSIEGGDGNENTIGSDKLSAAIREARLDDKVKAIVMRVNSPGGSALASDIIWREVALAKKAKPFIVSMGNVAASGGYYISCAADSIIAQPNTITGSIGVFGLMFNAQKMLKNKLGITVDTYKTGTYTDIGTVTRPMTEAERLMIQKDVDQVYNTFTARVAEGRKIPQAMVDSLGQGRVWSGVDALRIGLVDRLGGLDDAIASAAKMANVTNYRIKNMPDQKSPYQSLMQDLTSGAEAKYMQMKLGTEYKYWNAFQNIMSIQGIQAREFYEIGFN
ncbi:signal peptide peptidase SppA [soil metagenome]